MNVVFLSIYCHPLWFKFDKPCIRKRAHKRTALLQSCAQCLLGDHTLKWTLLPGTYIYSQTKIKKEREVDAQVVSPTHRIASTSSTRCWQKDNWYNWYPPIFDTETISQYQGWTTESSAVWVLLKCYQYNIALYLQKETIFLFSASIVLIATVRNTLQ